MIDTKPEFLRTDLLIIGGGAAGCMAAVEARAVDSSRDVLVLEKADIVRSGCVAAGLNAVNAYLRPDQSPESYLESTRRDSHGLVREDLVLSFAQGVTEATHLVESWGMEIHRDADGKPISKGPRSVQIRGESLKLILAERVFASGARVRNRVAVTNLIVRDGRACGAYGIDVRSGKLIVVSAGAVICATGGAAGLYPPRSDGSMMSRLWYSPYNVGSGYAIGLRAGAELTTLEMRFIPTRVRHVQAPTGTLVQAFGAKQVNALGEEFAKARAGYGGKRPTLPQQLAAMIDEYRAGRGPIYLDLSHLHKEKLDEAARAYLDMSPSLLLYLSTLAGKEGPLRIEMGTSGPYLLGGHTAAGYWVDIDRRTSLPGLYAAGDVAGGAPKKYVSGAWVEARIAARTALAECARPQDPDTGAWREELRRVMAPLRRGLLGREGLGYEDVLRRLQRIMDEYAGGPSTFFDLHPARLEIAREELRALAGHLDRLQAANPHQLMLAHEVIDRIDVARALVEHLLARDERRWPGYQHRVDVPEPDAEAPLYFVVSKRDAASGEVRTERRPHQGGTELRFAHAGG